MTEEKKALKVTQNATQQAFELSVLPVVRHCF